MRGPAVRRGPVRGRKAGQDLVDDDGGVEQAIGVCAPPVRDEGDAGERVPGEVLEDGVEYLVRKDASQARGQQRW